MQQKIYSLELLQTKCKCLVMPRTQEQLRKRVLELQILHRSQAVKIWELEEEKMNLVKELERMRKEKSVNEKEGVEESNQGRRVRFGGVHVSDNNGTAGKTVNAVEEMETVLTDALPLQEIEDAG